MLGELGIGTCHVIQQSTTLVDKKRSTRRIVVLVAQKWTYRIKIKLVVRSQFVGDYQTLKTDKSIEYCFV